MERSMTTRDQGDGDRSRARAGKVLVIDDSQTARTQMKHLLSMAGYSVEILASAFGATRLLLRQPISAVIVDLSMPGIPGDKLVEMLRSNQRTEELIIVIVSSCSSDELECVRSRCRADAAVNKNDLASTLVPTLARSLCGSLTSRLHAVRARSKAPERNSE
jgi:CheY-like chemotaxis protein